ncbi:MAG TPA: TPM domain-containing protein, partial [Bacilli bacterium]|nr:TPM domain-containing protein [Bacilli bacterium]
INDDNIQNVYRTPLVDASEKIYDYANLFTEDEKNNLYLQAQTYVSNNKFDIVVLTTELNYSDQQLEDYAADFYDYNDFGIDFEHYSGIILHINTSSYNRYYNIYTFGNAILYYDDTRIENILDYIFDDIKAGNYASGAKGFITESMSYYNEGIPSCNANAYITENGDIRYKYVAPVGPAFIVSAIISLVITIIFISKNKMVKKAKEAKEYLDKNSVAYTNKTDEFLHTHTTSYTVSSSSGGSGGSSTHSGSSGGFHGGGGGRHF